MSVLPIRLGGQVPAGQTVVRKKAPASDRSVSLSYFNATGGLQFRLYWDFEKSEEQLLWVINPNTYNPMIFEFEPKRSEINGINEFAVVAENLDIDNPQYGAFYAEFSMKE